MSIIDRLVAEFNFDDELIPFNKVTAKELATALLAEAIKLAKENQGKPCLVAKSVLSAQAYYDEDERLMATLTVTNNTLTYVEKDGVIL